MTSLMNRAGYYKLDQMLTILGESMLVVGDTGEKLVAQAQQFKNDTEQIKGMLAEDLSAVEELDRKIEELRALKAKRIAHAAEAEQVIAKREEASGIVDRITGFTTSGFSIGAFSN